MKKLLILLALVTTITSCSSDDEFCDCELTGEYYVGNTQYRLGSLWQDRTCDEVRRDQRLQVQLLRPDCGIACGTGMRITLQEALNGGSARLSRNCY